MAGNNGNGQAKSTWTFMFYINADATLANFAVQSLKQLQETATHKIVVAAQFGSDGAKDIPRLIFDGEHRKCSFDVNMKDQIARDTDMATSTSLSDFIDWVYEQPHCRESEHLGLVLWGHGPELLFDDYVSPGTHKDRTSFLTPATLAWGLKNSKFAAIDKRKIDIVGLDACNMSMVELAYELGPYAKFMVASQDDVPDFSFPYHSLLPAFGEKKCTDDEIGTICSQIPRLYITAYEDYIQGQQTTIPSLTLTSIRLENVSEVTTHLQTLAKILLESVRDKRKREAIIAARAGCKGFVAGLYADLHDFCEQLRKQYSANSLVDPDLTAICKEICAAIRTRGRQASVIANESPRDKHCQGLSIYLPYFTDDDQASSASALSVPLVKGSLEILQKGSLEILQKGSLEILQKGGMGGLQNSLDVVQTLRRQKIEETEDYYYELEFACKTGWGKFIRHGWSRCLAENAADKVTLFPPQNRSDMLDQRYSAEQCVLNLLSLCQDSDGTGTGEHSGGPSPEQPNDPCGSAKRPNGHGRHSRVAN